MWGFFIDHDACHDSEYVQVILTAKFHYPDAADQATHDASRRHGDSVQVRKECEKYKARCSHVIDVHLIDILLRVSSRNTHICEWLWQCADNFIPRWAPFTTYQIAMGYLSVGHASLCPI